MTEKEKMVAGLWHRADDPSLIQERQSAKSLLFELQQLHPSKRKGTCTAIAAIIWKKRTQYLGGIAVFL